MFQILTHTHSQMLTLNYRLCKSNLFRFFTFTISYTCYLFTTSKLHMNLIWIQGARSFKSLKNKTLNILKLFTLYFVLIFFSLPSFLYHLSFIIYYINIKLELYVKNVNFCLFFLFLSSKMLRISNFWNEVKLSFHANRVQMICSLASATFMLD